MFVEDYMTPDPQTVAASASLGHAQDLMRTRDVRHLAVVDESGRLVGLLTDLDVRSAIGYDERLGAKLTVSEVMTADPATIPVTATLDDALSILCSKRFGALPVVRGKGLVGIITRSDLLRAFYEVMGLDEPSRRVEVALPNGCTDLACVFKALASCEERVISTVVSRMRRDGGEPSLYLRIAGTESREVEKRLRDAAAIVLAPEHP